MLCRRADYHTDHRLAREEQSSTRHAQQCRALCSPFKTTYIMLITTMRGKYRLAVDSLALAAFLAACPAISSLFCCCCWPKPQTRRNMIFFKEFHLDSYPGNQSRRHFRNNALLHSSQCTPHCLCCVCTAVFLSAHTPRGCAVHLHHRVAQVSSCEDSPSARCKA